MKEHPPSEDCYKLWILLAQTRQAMYRARKKELSRYDTSPRQAAVLFIIKTIGDKATPAEISRWLFREPHSVAGILNRMEKQGFVRQSKDLERRNLIRVTVTDKGEQLYARVVERESICKIISALSARQRKQLVSCLNTLRSTSLREIGLEDNLPFP